MGPTGAESEDSSETRRHPPPPYPAGVLIVLAIVAAMLVVAAIVDWQGRRRGSRPDASGYSTHLRERRRDLRARRSMMNLGGTDDSDPYGDLRRR